MRGMRVFAYVLMLGMHACEYRAHVKLRRRARMPVCMPANGRMDAEYVCLDVYMHACICMHQSRKPAYAVCAYARSYARMRVYARR